MRVRKRCRLLLCLCALLSLGGCAAMKPEAAPVSAEPSLRLLSMPAYRDEEAAADGSATADGALRVDLWLDASQVAGGVNPNEDSMYPHSSRKYREGGFHYRYGNTVGWYENVLENMLAAAGSSRVRVLRCGNERLSDDALRAAGLPCGDADALRSCRRDLLTYAIDPMPDLFATFSAESMEDSFYSLGTPKLNQMERFAADGGALLENPGMVPSMSAALERQISALASEDAQTRAPYTAGQDDQQSPLRYALENLDLGRLSVITCDPAALRRLEGVTADGTPVKYIERLVRERGLFDAGLCVGLYAMRLDYLGQLASFCAADLSEPLLWGRLDYNGYTKKILSAMPMPRVLLALVVGKPSQLRAYADALNALLDGDDRLQGLRGPDDGQLSYTADGQTVVQQPFGFSYDYTELNRPSAGYYTQHTVGFALTSDAGDVRREGAMYTASIPPATGKSVLTLSWPAADLSGGVRLDLSALANARVEVIDSLLLTETLPNTPESRMSLTDEVSVIALRDKLYVFSQRERPFEDAPDASPFSLTSVSLSEDGASVLATVEAERARLEAGYYRLRLTADVSGQQFSWPLVPWTQNGSGVSAEITNRQIAQWESFSAVLTRYARDLSNVPRAFTHAWGGVDNKSYKGAAVPDFPPVYRAPCLEALFGQLQSAANVDTAPYIRCVLDVFVPAIPK